MVLSVSVIYCYVTSKPKTQCFKTTAFIIFQVLWIKTGLGGSSGSLALTSLQLSQALTGKGPLQAPSQSGCKVQFLAGCWTKALFSHSCWPKTTPSSLLLCDPVMVYYSKPQRSPQRQMALQHALDQIKHVCDTG